MCNSTIICTPPPPDLWAIRSGLDSVALKLREGPRRGSFYFTLTYQILQPGTCTYIDDLHKHA